MKKDYKTVETEKKTASAAKTVKKAAAEKPVKTAKKAVTDKVKPAKEVKKEKPVKKAETAAKKPAAKKTKAVNLEGLKVAVVDVNKIVAKSSKVIAMKKQHQLNNVALQNWLSSVKQLLDNTTDAKKKAALVKQYDAEFAQKQAYITADYNKNLREADKEITAIIEQRAKEENYDLVFSKTAVVFGGNDITDSIAEYIK